MKVFLSTCLLFILLSPGAALKCATCFGYGGKCRDEDTRIVECAPDQVSCVTVLAELTPYTFPFNIMYKGCSRAQDCQTAYLSASSVMNQYGHVKNYCCQTDECNTMDVQVPDRSSLRPNGLQCPGFVSTSDYCYGPGTVQCVGTEDQCIEISYELSPFGLPAKQINAKGCGNQQLCATKPGPLIFGDGVIKFNIYEVNCYSGKGSCELPQTKW